MVTTDIIPYRLILQGDPGTIQSEEITVLSEETESLSPVQGIIVQGIGLEVGPRIAGELTTHACLWPKPPASSTWVLAASSV